MSTQNNINESFLSSRRFFDDKNYPRGMSRSGEYSISEVQLLEKYGVALLDISSGKRQPKTEEEAHFKGVCDGQYQATSKIEKAWIKYQTNVMCPKQFHTLFGSRKVEDNSETVVTDFEDVN